MENKLHLHFVSIIIVLLITAVSKAQYRIINDNDGFVNVRKTPGTSGAVICRLLNGIMVRESGVADTIHKNWIPVEFYLPKDIARQIKFKPESAQEYPASKVMTGHLLFTGYIHKDRLINIHEQQQLTMDRSRGVFVLYNDSINVIIDDAAFEEGKHKIGKEGNFVEKIDGHYFVGSDGEVPRYEFKTFSVRIGSQKINIPKTSYYDLYEPNLNNFTSGFVYKQTLYVIMHNSDGAGTYDVVFIFKNKKYIGRYVFDGEC